MTREELEEIRRKGYTWTVWKTGCMAAANTVPALVDEVQRLRSALEFYAEPCNWSNTEWGTPAVPPAYVDEGERARKTLGGAA